MNQQMAKRLRKTLLHKTDEILLLLRQEFGEMTKEMTETSVYRNFKKLYKQGKVPPSLIEKTSR